jgi:hypothetical protein
MVFASEPESRELAARGGYHYRIIELLHVRARKRAICSSFIYGSDKW